MARTKKPKTYATHITTPTGERVYVRGKNKEDFEEKVLRLRMELHAGVDIANDLPFEKYAKTWLAAYKEGKIRGSSLSLVETNLRLHVLPFFSGMTLREIKSLHIQLYLKSIAEYSKSLQSHCFQIVKSILSTAADNGLIAKSPVRKEDAVSGENAREEEPLTDEQARLLLQALEGTNAYTFCLIALSTGMRRGEIIGLMWEDIDFKNKIIEVAHNKSFPCNAQDAPVTTMLKTEAAHRKIPMSAMLTDHLLFCKAQSKSPYVVAMRNGNSLTKSAFRSLWSNVERRTLGEDRVGREMGGSYGKLTVMLDFHCHPHQLRHTFITKLFEEGLDLKQVQYLAGHAKPEMTLRIYTHYRDKQRAKETHEQVCEALDYLTPPLALPAPMQEVSA